MKTIQKITLALLTMVSVSSLSAVTLLLDTAAGDAEMAGAINGDAQKIGANKLTQSGVITGSLDVNAGSVLLKAAPTVKVELSGTGALEVHSSVPSIPAVLMTAASIITSNAALDIGTVSGTAALGLLGANAVTMSGDAYLADCDAAASLAAASAHIQTGSTLPATASFSGTLNLDGDIAAGGAVTMGAAGIVNANVSQAAARFTSLTARNIVFAAGGVVFSQAVIVG